MTNRKRKGKIFVLSSPSGGGKTSVCARIKQERFDIRYSISATTRAPREGEKNGRDYIFISRKRFKALISNKSFLEWEDNFGHMYGTPRRFVERATARGEDVILAIDVKGGMKVKKLRKDAVLVFILPPSIAMLKRRLKKRKTETTEAAARRLRVAKKELALSGKYDYAIVNDNLAKAVEAFRSIVIAERNRL
jgi:guanylate kinase